MHHIAPAAWRSWRPWLALLLMVAAYFLEHPVQGALYAPLRQGLHLHMISDGVMSPLPYGVLMVVRLAWNLALVTVVWTALGRPLWGFPVGDGAKWRHLALGLSIGVAVMAAAILAIIATGNAAVSIASQPLAAALLHGGAWLLFDMVGAAGEELYGRAAVLMVAERFFGWKGAVVVSGLMFIVIHVDNPGASTIWLARLGLQGMLLACAVYRTRSLWWSIGYHTGWNWASAPLFGAAGSGYLNEGHLFDFVPRGSTWITGGAVGPEGSVFAFAAVLVAAALLMLATRRGGARP